MHTPTLTVAPLRPRPGRAARHAVLIGATLAVALTLAGCSGSGAEDDAAADPTGASDTDGPARDGGARPEAPGVTGEVAALTGDIAQVQSSDAQTAVTWTADTTVTQQVAGSLADVTVGSCVSAVAATDREAASGSATDPVAASQVTITPAEEDGTCGAGAGGLGGGEVPGGAPGDFPTDVDPGDLPDGTPTDMRSGAPDAASRLSGAVFGTVTAVTDGGFTVEQVTFSVPGDDDASAEPETSAREVTVSDETTYTTTRTADASVIAVGQCMTARGDEDSAGMVTADSIALSDPGDDGCTTGFGRGTMGGGQRPDAQTQDDSDA